MWKSCFCGRKTTKLFKGLKFIKQFGGVDSCSRTSFIVYKFKIRK